MRSLTVVLGLAAALAGLSSAEENKTTAPSQAGETRAAFVNLADYGDVSTPEKAQATLDRLAAELTGTNRTAGVIVMDSRVPGPDRFWPVNTYQTNVEQRCNVTLLDVRTGTVTVKVPQAGDNRQDTWGWSGIIIERTLDLKDGGNIQGSQPLAIVNNLLRGAYSYCAMPEYGRQLEGTNAERHYVLNPIGSFTDRKVGWDSEKKQYYVVTKTNGNVGLRKNFAPGLAINSYNNADVQTMGSGLDARTHKYGVGDNFVISGLMYYQDNVFSGGGDEGGVVLNAETYHDLASFHSTVESFNPETGELVYAPGQYVCADALALSRPLINLNPSKWLTNGVVRIVPPDTLGDLGGFQEDGKGGYKDWSGSFNVRAKTVYKGKSYPSLEKKDEKYGGAYANWLGGLIEASADAPWDESIVGRYFAVDDPAEKYEKGGVGYGWGYMGWPFDDLPVRRWYRICEFRKNADGTKVIKIVRVRWAAVPAGAPTLIKPDNYTWDGHDRPLRYIIAPGAEVCDISEAGVLEARKQYHRISPNTKCKRLITVVPNDDAKNAFAFAKGDRVEQAVGGDPFVPVPLRIRMHDGFPSTMEDAGVLIRNDGPIARQMGLTFLGQGKSLAGMAQRKDGQPSFIDAIDIGTVVGSGMRFRAQVRDAALTMEQRGDNFQPLTWMHHDSTQAASLGVEPESGNFTFKGGNGLDLNASGLVKAGGLSATPLAARNLRGIAVKAAKGATSLAVKFAEDEADADYAVTVQPNWRTTDWTTGKNTHGFTVQFSEPAPDGATIDWVMVR